MCEENRICRKCGENKKIDDFRIKNNKTGSRGHICYSCKKLSMKEYNRKTYVHKPRIRKVEHSRICKECHIEKTIDSFRYENKKQKWISKMCHDCFKAKRNKKRIERHNKNKELDNNQNREWYNKNKESRKKKIKEWRDNNPEKVKEIRHNYFKRSDKKLLRNLRTRVSNALKGIFRSIHTMDLMGCSIEEFKDHLQKTAINNGYLDFDINNYVGRYYHIDHIIPCDAFNLSCKFHQRLCFHWSNMQILDIHKNSSKHAKYSLDLIC